MSRVLSLRPPRPEDEAVVRAAITELQPEGFEFAPGWRDGMTYADLLAALRDNGAGLDFRPHEWVPVSFLLAEVDGEVVGRTSIRHALNEWLAQEGGHIGYAVLAAHRRRGYATEILRQSLVVARDGEVPLVPGDPPKRRYWIG